MPEAYAPRTVADIVKVLEQYKPDPAVRKPAAALLNQQPPATENRGTLLRFYRNRGLAERALGDDTAAIASLRKALEYLAPSDMESFFVVLELAQTEFTGGNLVSALRLMAEHKAQIPANMPRLIIAYEAGLANLHGQLGNFDAARRALGAAENAYSRWKGQPDFVDQRYITESIIERTRGEIFMGDARYKEAEVAFAKALRAGNADIPFRARRLGRNSVDHQNNRQHIFLLRKQAAAQKHLGWLNEAELTVRNALKISLESVGRFTSSTALNLQLFAFILIEQGRFEEGALMAQEAMKSVEGSGAPGQAMSSIQTRKALGAALVAAERWDEALVTFDKMNLGLKGDADLERSLGKGDIDWAQAYLKRNRGAEARKMLEGMLALSIKNYGEGDLRTAWVRGFHAVALEKTGARAQALGELAKAVPVLVEQARQDIAADTGSMRQARRLAYVLENYIELLAKAKATNLPTPGIDPVAESFRLADIARGSGVQRALSASAARANISDPALAELARKEQDAQWRINSLSEILKNLLAAPPDQQLPNVIAMMRKSVESLKAERTALKSAIEKRFPDYAELVDPKPITLSQLQRSLRAGETLISIYLGEDSAFVWAVPQTGAASLASSPLTLAQVTKTVEQLRKALDPAASAISQIPAFDIAAAAQLYEQLLKPLEPVWRQGSGPHRLLIVPHGPLGQLPFGLLPMASLPLTKGAVAFEEYRKVPWLIREAILTQLPSVTALTTLRRAPAPKSERRLFLGIGDPLFSKEQAAEGAKLAQATGGTTRGLPIALRSAPKTAGVNSAELALLPRLPDTADELNEIAKALGADLGSDVILQKNANEQTVKTMNLADRRILHFATHGLVPGELNGLTQPALALTAPEVAGVEGDGLLTMDEVLALKLNADWVVLSACNTASGAGAGSEAISGLGQAFFYAGARALLVSNWPVETVSARRLMTNLFKRYIAGAATAKAESLRQAMIELLDGQGALDPVTRETTYTYAHPLFWAPFALVGD